MKLLRFLIAVIVFTPVIAFSQLKEGHIAYNIEMTSEDPEMAMAVMMFSGSKMDLYFNERMARTDLSMGAMMSMTTIVDNKTEDVLILMGGMMGDKAILTNATEMAEGEEVVAVEPTVKLTKEKKMILGYNCSKAIIVDEDGNEMDYWYTEDIKTVSTDKNAATSKLPGLALEYKVDRDGMIMSFTASKVEKSLDKTTSNEKLSLTIPEGYEKLTYEEFTSFGN